MGPVTKNGKDAGGNTATPSGWGWVDQVTATESATITRKELFRVYRMVGYPECAYARKRQCKCKKNPHCLWGLGDVSWRSNECVKEEESQIREEGQIAGLLNQGQTCYVNSLLQLWFHNPILRPAILSWEPPYGVSTDDNAVYTPVCAVGHLQLMFARMKASKQRTINTASFVNALGLDPGQQQDAEEFAKLLLNCVTQLLENSYQNSGISRVFNTCFTGETQFQTTCERCHNVTLGRTEEFNELQLSVMATLEESFRHYFSEERLEKDNQYFCNNCMQKQDAIRKVRLLKLPHVLNIQLMRFVFDPAAKEKKKVMKCIAFPAALDMTGYLHSDGSGAGGNGECAASTRYNYILNAVLIHHGNRASSGHYTSHIKDPATNCWMECNDDKVAEVNNKSHSEKLVIKAEETTEGAESQSVSEVSSPLKSRGAYMLVYTRQEHFSKFEDPELPGHISEVIKYEDALFESKQHSEKLAKEEETLKRSQRHSEVMLLYEPKYPPPDPEVEEESQGAEGSDSEVKIICTKPPAAQRPPIDVNSIDFISTAWLERWLAFDPAEELPPISNEDIVCRHGKVRPPRKNEPNVLYKIIPSNVAEVLYQRYTGHRLSGEAALCTECVTAHFNYLVGVAKLEEDAKVVAEAVKVCDQEFEKNGKRLTDAFHGNKFLIGKESLRDWRKQAKKLIDQKERFEIDGITSNEGEDQWKMNQELTCVHGNLTINRAVRRRIQLPGYMILTNYFPNGVWYGSGESDCDICLALEQSNAAVFESYKQYAQEEKNKMSDLFRGCNRPNTLSIGTFWLVPTTFINTWRNFVRNPVSEPPTHIPTIELLCDLTNCGCTEPRLKYPFTALLNERNNAVVEEDIFEHVAMIRKLEMDVLCEKRSNDVLVNVTIAEDRSDRRNRRKYSHNIEICEQSAWEWIKSVVEQRFIYEDDIIIRKCDNEEEMLLDSSSNGHDLDSDEVPSKVFRGDNDLQLRRSVRRRPSRYDHKYKIHSSLIIRDFQISDLCKDMNAGLSDQHLFFNGKELSEDERRKSFAELRIARGSVLYLTIDKPTVNGNSSKGEREETPPKSAQVERGFSGTALLSASFQPPRTVSTPFSSPLSAIHSPSAPPWTPDSDSSATALNTTMIATELEPQPEDMEVDPPEEFILGDLGAHED